MSDKKKQDGEKDKKARKSARAVLLSLVGMTMKDMSNKQQADFITAMAQLANYMDDTGKVKPLT